MAFHNLRSFLNFLESKGDLARIKEQVDPHLEITEIASRVMANKGPALLFENVKGSSFPLVVNTLGTDQRLEWALGRSPEVAGDQIGTMAHKLFPPSLSNLWAQRSGLKRVLSMKPSKIRNAPVFKNKIEPANLNLLPVAQSWPKDGGPFFTFPLVMTKSPADGKQNMGVYRMQKFSFNETGMHWQIGKGGGYHYQQAERRGESLPVMVVLGADPILMMCGILPLPEGLDESVFAGFLRGQGTKVGSVASSPLQIPVEAEFVLEGKVPPKERRIEGPYGDHFGHYSHEAPFPVFHVDRVWHRDNPVFPISVVGKPPQEDQVIGDAVQKLLLPLLKVMHPEIQDLWAYQEAGFHNLLVISVHQRFAKEALKTALWALGEGQLALTKCVVLVDPDVNARDFNSVLKAIRANFNPAKDFVLLPSTSQDTLDFTSYKMNLGSKMILDATRGQDRPLKIETHISLSKIRESDSRIQNLKLIENTLLVIQAKTGAREILEKMLKFSEIQSLSLVAVVSDDIPLDNPTLLIWGLFTRFDCERDTFFSSVRIEKGHPVYNGPLLIDASWKPGYPEALSMNESVIQKVDKKWNQYGIPLSGTKPRSPNKKMPEQDQVTQKEKELTHLH